jgi:hypothetical protein
MSEAVVDDCALFTNLSLEKGCILSRCRDSCPSTVQPFGNRWVGVLGGVKLYFHEVLLTFHSCTIGICMPTCRVNFAPANAPAWSPTFTCARLPHISPTPQLQHAHLILQYILNQNHKLSIKSTRLGYRVVGLRTRVHVTPPQ